MSGDSDYEQTTESTGQRPPPAPVFVDCKREHRQLNGRVEPFYIMTLLRGEEPAVRFVISDTEARESYSVSDQGPPPCRTLADALFNGFYDELRVAG